MTRLLVILAATAGILAGGLATPGRVLAEPCTGPSGGFGGHGGGRCDYPPAADGSFTRCDTVYVFGVGGTTCYQVPPGTPHM